MPRSDRQRRLLRRLPAAAPHPVHHVPHDEADAAEHDHEGQQGGEDQARDAGAVGEHLDGVQKGPRERVGRVDGAGLRHVLLAQEDRKSAVGRGLAQRFELGAQLLDGQLHVVDAILHGEHLVDVVGGGQEADQPALHGVVVAQTRLEVDVLGGDVVARGGHALHVAEGGEPLYGGVEAALRHSHGERGVRVRTDGRRRLVVGGGGRAGVEREWLDRTRHARRLAAEGAGHHVAAHAPGHRVDAVDAGQKRTAGDQQGKVAGAQQVVRGEHGCRRHGCGDVAAAVPPASVLSTHHLLRTGDLSLLVARGTLLSSVDRINAMTRGMGGYVMSSALGSESPGMPGPIEPLPLNSGTAPAANDKPATTIGTDPYATLTVRVPESSFDAAVKRFAALGDVQSVSTSSDDVTSQYVDLQARLRHYRAVERRLVRFLAATDNVNQMLAVQDRIDNVQLTIEQLSAQLKSLHETTTYGTLSIFLREKGVPQAGAIDPSDTFTGTLLHSIKVFGHGARVTGLVLTALLPFVVVFGGICLVVWYVPHPVRH